VRPKPPRRRASFSEREFYLQEFRGRTLLVAGRQGDLRDSACLARVLDVLGRNATRVVVASTRRRGLERLVGRVLPASRPRLEATLWRALRAAPRLGVVVGGGRPFASACRDLALRLQVFKVVWIDAVGGVRGRGGERLSFVHRNELQGLRAAERRRAWLLREVEGLLAGGIPAVNVCTLQGLEQELFTYAGSGTLFTSERYVTVRRLGIDDFDAAHDLFERGVAEGYLVPRARAEVDRSLASGFGAFVEGRHLAGIGALLVHAQAGVGEIGSLYTLTRFLGEGVGANLVAFALCRARELGLRSVFACTTSRRVGRFFERQGFRPVPLASLPASKWRGYDAARRRSVRCYARALPTAARRRRSWGRSLHVAF
jgi:N-acetylglutamate synthase-like GNAT family acetyltransferase